MKKDIFTKVSLILMTLFLISGCEFTFEHFGQDGNAIIDEEFKLVMKIADDGGQTDNKTAMVGLRLPDNCSFVRGNVTDADWWDGSDKTDYELLETSAFVLSLLDNSTCPARPDYQWIGLKGDREAMDSNTLWQLGEIVITCSDSGTYDLDVAVGVYSENITNYFCNNTFTVYVDSVPEINYTGISTCNALDNIEGDLTGFYELTNNIDCAGSTFDGVNGTFTGSFNGNGYTISNLLIDSGNAGIFGEVSGQVGFSYPTISDLKVNNITINQTATIRTGAIAKRTVSGIFENLVVDNSLIQGANGVGGVFGTTNGGIVNNITISNSIIIASADEVGGIVGGTDIGGTNLFSYNNFISGGIYVGGILGRSGRFLVFENVKVEDLTIYGTNIVGGFTGELTESSLNKALIEDVFIKCSSSDCGGVVGLVFDQGTGLANTISNIIVHNVTVNATANTGGIVGKVYHTNFTNVLISEINLTSGDTTTEGIIAGNNTHDVSVFSDIFYDSDNIVEYDTCGNSSANITNCESPFVSGENTSALKERDTYTNWDFTNVFSIKSGEYPGFLFDTSYCVQDWSCFGYAPCNISDLAPCNNVTDLNSCGADYGGDYSEFSSQACNYCEYSLTQLNESICSFTTHLKEICYEDTNFASCCNITSLGSDCAFGNSSEGCVNESCDPGYVSEYESEDLSKIVIDIIAGYGVQIVGLVVVIVIFTLLIWVGRYRYPELRKKK